MRQILVLIICCFTTMNCSAKSECMSEKEIDETKLFEYVESKNLDKVKELIAQGATIDQKNEKGETPLLRATRLNLPEIAIVLLEAGANVNIQDNIQDSPFLYACAEGRTRILKEMLKYRPDVKIYNRFGGNGLIPAAEKGHLDNVKILLEQTDMEVNHINKLGWTALLEAVILSKGEAVHQEIIRTLIKHGADVNIPDKEGVTALTHAKEKGYTAIVDILVNAAAKE